MSNVKEIIYFDDFLKNYNLLTKECLVNNIEKLYETIQENLPKPEDDNSFMSNSSMCNQRDKLRNDVYHYFESLKLFNTYASYDDNGNLKKYIFHDISYKIGEDYICHVAIYGTAKKEYLLNNFNVYVNQNEYAKLKLLSGD